jgi:hypothetical protein
VYSIPPHRTGSVWENNTDKLIKMYHAVTAPLSLILNV